MSIAKKVDIAGDVDTYARLGDEGNMVAVRATLDARNAVEPSGYARDALNIGDRDSPIVSRGNAGANAAS